jgi:hypothetical protein
MNTLDTIRAVHDHAITLGAVCPPGCLFGGGDDDAHTKAILTARAKALGFAIAAPQRN